MNVMGNPHTSLIEMQISDHYGKQYGDVSRIFKVERPSCSIIPGHVEGEIGRLSSYLPPIHCRSAPMIKIRVLFSLLNHQALGHLVFLGGDNTRLKRFIQG